MNEFVENRVKFCIINEVTKEVKLLDPKKYFSIIIDPNDNSCPLLDFIIPSKILYNGECFNVTELGPNAFDNIALLQKLYIPETLKSLEWCFYQCFQLKSIYVDRNNENFCDIDGVLYTKDCKKILAYPNAHGEKYTIPDNVTHIGNYAFKSCSIKELKLPDTITYIGTNAFYGCDNLKNIILPDNINHIGKYVITSNKEKEMKTHFIYRGNEYDIKEIQKIINK